VLQHCMSAVWGSHRHVQLDAASDQQFPAFERHWDPSERWALVTKTRISIVWVSRTMCCTEAMPSCDLMVYWPLHCS
jgi:hypothetical protein